MFATKVFVRFAAFALVALSSVACSGAHDNKAPERPAGDGALAKLTPTHTLKSKNAAVIAWRPGTNVVAFGTSASDMVHLWDVTRPEPHDGLPGCRDHVGCLSFSKDGSVLAVGTMKVGVKGAETLDAGGSVFMWDVERKEVTRRFERHAHAVRAVAISPNREMVASGDDDRVFVWSASTGQELYSFGVSALQRLAWSEDGRRLIAADNDQVTVWDLPGEKGLGVGERRVADRDPARPRAVSLAAGIALSAVPDVPRRQVFGRDEPRPAEIVSHSLATGKVLGTLRVSQGQWMSSVRTMDVSPDGRWLLTGDYDLVRLWDLRRMREFARMDDSPATTGEVAFSPDGRRAVARDGIGDLRVFDIRVDAEPLRQAERGRSHSP